MSDSPIYDDLATPAMPTRSLSLGRWLMWCVVCEGEDFTHEHPEDPRAPKFGASIPTPTWSEGRWIADQHALPIEEQHYYKRLREKAPAHV